MAIILRAVKGSPLTIAENDGNFTDLDGRVQDLEDGGGSDGPRQIDFIEQVSNTLIVHYTDTTEDGPFDLGALNLRFRDAWLPSTGYLVYDIVTINGSTYMVLFAHTSELSFDPGANDGDGHDFYGLLLTNPDNVLPIDGDTGQVLRKSSATDFDIEWADPLLEELFDVDFDTDGPEENEVLIFDGANWTSGHDALESLTDIDMPTAGPDTGEVLIFDGANWTSGHDVLEMLTDVDMGTSGPAADDVLSYDGASWVPAPLTPAQLRSSVVLGLGTTGTISLDPTLGDVFAVTPTGAITLNAASAPAGARITLVVTTSGTSSYNITPSTNFKSTGALATGTVSAKVFTITFVGDGTNLNEVSRTTAM